jgi:hypothetical protein
MYYLQLRFSALCITACDYFGTDSFNFSSAIPFLGLFLDIKLLFIYHFLLEICYSSSNFKTRLQSYCFHRKSVIVVYRKRIYTYLNVKSYFYAYSVIYIYIYIYIYFYRNMILWLVEILMEIWIYLQELKCFFVI